MKRIYLFAAVTAIALAACTKTETTGVSEGNLIKFDNAFVGNPTKAVEETNLSSLQADGFFVYGGYDGVNVFENQKVNYSNSNWEYTPLRSWINGKVYKFAAYAPEASHDASNNVSWDYTSGGLKFENYISDMDNQNDFIYDKIESPITAQPTGNGPINFAFEHQLSMVKFTIKNGFGDGVNVTISDLTIGGFCTKADFTDGVWGTPGEQKNFTHGAFGVMTSTDMEVSDEFVVIPQTSTLDITFNLTVVTEDGVSLSSNKLISTSVSDQEFNKGFRYNFIATVTGETIDLETIEFGNPTVTEWDSDLNDNDAEDDDIELNLNN